MDRIRIFISAVVIAVAGFAGYAADPKPVFAEFGDTSDFTYTYVSPMMLRTFNSQAIFGSTNGAINMDPKNLRMIEMISTRNSGRSDELLKRIEKIKKDGNMELMSYQKSTDSKFEWYVDKIDSKGVVNKLLLLKWSRNGVMFTGIYIVGDITSNDIQRLLLTM